MTGAERRRAADRTAPAVYAGAIVSIGQIAKQAGWSYERMKRHLLKCDAEAGGTILTKTGKGRHTRYTTTAGALERLHPQWFARNASLQQEVSVHANQIQDHDLMVERAHQDIGRLRFRVQSLESEVERLKARLASEAQDRRQLALVSLRERNAITRRLDALEAVPPRDPLNPFGLKGLLPPTVFPSGIEPRPAKRRRDK